MGPTIQLDDRFLLMQGVHRCLAVHLAGLTKILAAIEDDGAREGIAIIDIGRVWSPKPDIRRWDRNRDFQELIESMKTPLGRHRIDPVIVERISETRSLRYTRLIDVRILEDTVEEE